jgi:hypothetical protein
MAGDPKRIDPRYDPAFQRGYEGEVRTGAHAESALRRTASVTPAAGRVGPPPVASTSAFAPAPEAVTPMPTAAASASTAAAPVPATAVAPASPASVAEAPESATPLEVTRNPFYLGLGALAVALVVAGVVWLDVGFEAIRERQWASDSGYWAGYVMSVGAPLSIALGVAIAAGLLFVFARGWRARR